jgi:molecular chaperone GrpE
MADEPKTDDQPQDYLKAKVEEAQAQDEQKNAEAEESVQQEDETEQLKEQLARCMADMQNYKRRAEEDKAAFVKFANAELLKEILPIIDNFDRAFSQVAEHISEEPWVQGVTQTHETFVKTLAKLGVNKIPTVGETLDPTRHEAVMQGFGEKDKVIEELEPGYLYNEVTLKAAKVKVGDGGKK